ECRQSELRLLPGGRGECVGDDLFEGGAGGLPAEFVVDAGGVGGEVGGFWCGWGVAAGDGVAGEGFHGVDDVGDAAGLAAADVVGAPGAGLAGGQRPGEGVGHVGDVEEVADGAAVAVDGDLRGVAVVDGEEFGDQAGEVVVGAARG